MGAKSHSQEITKLKKERVRGTRKKLQALIEAAKRFGVEDYITIHLDSKAHAHTMFP
jgi:hypothetical protein